MINERVAIRTFAACWWAGWTGLTLAAAAVAVPIPSLLPPATWPFKPKESVSHE